MISGGPISYNRWQSSIRVTKRPLHNIVGFIKMLKQWLSVVWTKGSFTLMFLAASSRHDRTFIEKGNAMSKMRGMLTSLLTVNPLIYFHIKSSFRFLDSECCCLSMPAKSNIDKHWMTGSQVVTHFVPPAVCKTFCLMNENEKMMLVLLLLWFLFTSHCRWEIVFINWSEITLINALKLALSVFSSLLNWFVHKRRWSR